MTGRSVLSGNAQVFNDDTLQHEKIARGKIDGVGLEPAYVAPKWFVIAPAWLPGSE